MVCGARSAVSHLHMACCGPPTPAAPSQTPRYDRLLAERRRSDTDSRAASQRRVCWPCCSALRGQERCHIEETLQRSHAHRASSIRQAGLPDVGYRQWIGKCEAADTLCTCTAASVALEQSKRSSQLPLSEPQEMVNKQLANAGLLPTAVEKCAVHTAMPSLLRRPEEPMRHGMCTVKISAQLQPCIGSGNHRSHPNCLHCLQVTGTAMFRNRPHVSVASPSAQEAVSVISDV